MSRHVHRMRRRGSDLAVVPGGCQPIRRQQRCVAGVNDVVHDSRMIGIFGEQRIEDRHGPVLRRQAGVIRCLGRQQRQGIEGSRIGIARMPGIELCHRRGIALDAGLVLALVGPKELAECRDVPALAGALCRGRARCLHFGPAARAGAFVGTIPDLMEHAHRDAPMRHGAVRVTLRDLGELPLRFFVPEVVQQRDGAVEGYAHLGGARDGESNASQAFTADGPRRARILNPGPRRKRQRPQDEKQ